VTTAQPEEESWREPLLADTREIGGVWANRARVVSSRHEFTIDFIRVDYASEPPHDGIIVARVALSPFLLAQLTAVLEETLQDYSEQVRREVMPE
jgi:hypothetical protein